ncbi:hypothetical protein ACIA5E_26140 [Nocardia asteroides]|uniref:hypothetical protein n=1 Tax=Nocardia asteroides TaxID=1824 RepID=UPI0037BBC04C
MHQRNESDQTTGLAVDPAVFAGVDQGCAAFLEVIDQIVALATEIGGQPHWGLGEEDPRLISGAAVVARLRAKAAGIEGNSICAVMTAHAAAVAEIRKAHRLALSELTSADATWCRQLQSTDPAASGRDPREQAQ